MATINLEDLPESVQQLVMGGTRSPIPQPLKDLRAPTTARGRLHRAHFEWSADPDPNPPEYSPYPMLFWDASGVEHAISDVEGLKTKPADWQSTPPFAAPMSEMDALQKELLALSPEDRAFLLEEQRKERIARIRNRMAHLPDAALAQLQQAQPEKTDKKAQKTA